MSPDEKEYMEELVMVALRKVAMATTMVITPNQILAIDAEFIQLRGQIKELEEEHFFISQIDDTHAVAGGDLAKVFAEQVAQLFFTHGAQNYLEIKLKAKDGKIYVLNLQLVGGETPAEQIANLRVENEQLKGNK